MKIVTSRILQIVLLLISSVVYAQQDDLLRPEVAFDLQARVEGDRIIAEYRIAPGYYMYRDAFQYDLQTEGVAFAEPQVPDGKIKQDEFFGEVEIYRDQVAIALPLVYQSADKPGAITIKTTGQGCADIGVCYPPLYQVLTMNLNSTATVLPQPYQFQATTVAQTESEPDKVNELQQLLGISDNESNPVDDMAEAANNVASDALSLLQSLGEDIGLQDDDDIPHPDDAFKLAATIDSNNIIQSEIQLYKNTYLYRDKMKVEMIDGNGHTIGAISLPQGDEKNDEFFGLMQVYHDYLKVSIPILSEAQASNQFALAYKYQGCVEDKICYPPITKYFKVDLADRSLQISDDKPQLMLAAATTSTSIPSATATTAPATAPEVEQTEQDKFAGILAERNLLLIVGLFFLAGVGLTFTPCVFPMIPILSGIIAGQGENITTRKAFTLSLVYVLAMASTYAVAGAIVGRFGAEFNIQAWFQDPVILSVFAGIFVLLSLSMFGFYDLQMPNFIQSRLTEYSNKQEGGTLVGVGIMGLLSALIVGPCITAPLVGVLIFISQTQDMLLGGLALFALGLGMGAPLLLIGTSAGKYLPRAGTWMDAVKAVFGIGLLAVAIWLLERILPTEITMLLMAVLIIISGVYMGAVDRLPEGASGWRKLWKGVGIILLLYGAFYLYGVAAGSKDLVQPLKGITGGTAVSGPAASQGKIQFQQIKGEQGLQQALAAAEGKPVMLDFYADWCISCKVNEKYAFTHPEVLAALEGFVTLKTDVTENDKQDQLLMKSLGIIGPPAILFYDRNGQEIPGSRMIGEMSGEKFAEHINRYTGNL